MPDRLTLTDAGGKRRFDAFAAAILVFIIDPQERFLLLAHPERQGRWEVINGKIDAGDTLLAAALREVAEEAGPDVRVRPLGVVHAYSFRYDEVLHDMISIGYLCEYQGGEVVPGDDMAGSGWRWLSLNEIIAEEMPVIVPRFKWFFARAVDLYRLWKDQAAVDLQPVMDETMRNKYEAGRFPD